MNSQVELLPCPFCGGEAKLYNFPDEHPYIYQIGCIVCATAYGCKYSHSEKQAAINMWNKRIPITDIPGVKELAEKAYKTGVKDRSFWPISNANDLTENYMKAFGGQG